MKWTHSYIELLLQQLLRAKLLHKEKHGQAMASAMVELQISAHLVKASSHRAPASMLWKRACICVDFHTTHFIQGLFAGTNHSPFRFTSFFFIVTGDEAQTPDFEVTYFRISFPLYCYMSVFCICITQPFICGR